jgi:hypothetical protein
VHLLQELRDRGRVGGAHPVAQHLHRPERAQVVVALVVERVVQGGGGVGDLGVQLVGGVRARAEPVLVGQEADQRVQRGRHGVAVVLEQRDRAREPDGERVGDVGARPGPSRPSTPCLWSSAAATSDGSTCSPRRRPGHDVQPQPVADTGVCLQIVGAEDESHPANTVTPGEAAGDRGGSLSGVGRRAW